MRLHILLGILILYVAASTAQKLSSQAAALERLLEGVNQFSGEFVQAVAKTNRNNFVVSPIGAYLALTDASFGARRHTEDVFNNLLKLTGVPSDMKKMGALMINGLFNSFDKSELRVASGIFVSSEIELNSNFIADTTKYRCRPAQSANFWNPVEATNFINSWSDKCTNGGVRNIIDHNLDRNTQAALFSAVNFKGTPMYRLVPLSASEMVAEGIAFTYENGTTGQLPFKSGFHWVQYGEYPEVGASFIEIPYKSDVFYHNKSMFIIIPKLSSTLAYLEKNFHRISVKKLYERSTRTPLTITLPQFEIKSHLDIGIILKKMGFEHIFDTKKADFSGIFSRKNFCTKNVFIPDIAITRVVQKTSINIDGKGIKYNPPYDDSYFFEFEALSPFYVIVATAGKNPINILTARFTGKE
ncbi:serpin B10-like [Venturia canescens]|uniref:serpin B10-like n=1 Tax=Venturia canescens TaxID=32260 RepID=UPI001C9CD0A3|nr:serpin B10-like [Venturia canescens]